MNKNKIDFITTKESGGSKLGQKIRKLLLNNNDENLCKTTEIFLFAADRAQHIETIIKLALKNNKIVICDRYIDSTIAYQGYGRDFDLNTINTILDICTNKLLPDIIIFLDVLIETGLLRTTKKIK